MEPNYKKLLVSLLSSFNTSDHMGDVFENALQVAKKAGLVDDVDIDNTDELSDHLTNNHDAVSVWGL